MKDETVALISLCLVRSPLTDKWEQKEKKNQRKRLEVIIDVYSSFVVE